MFCHLSRIHIQGRHHSESFFFCFNVKDITIRNKLSEVFGFFEDISTHSKNNNNPPTPLHATHTFIEQKTVSYLLILQITSLCVTHDSVQ